MNPIEPRSRNAAATSRGVDPAAACWRELHHAACAPYRRAGRFAWHFARSKLGRDPLFRSLLERGDLPARARVLDIGCGQGLVASLLLAVEAQHARSAWPAGWSAPPLGATYTGFDLMQRDVRRAEAALGDVPRAPQFHRADMRDAVLPPSDAVLLFDVLHYIDPAAQQRLLERVRDVLAGGRGRLLMRVGDASSRGFAISQWVDRAVTRLGGYAAPPSWGRPLDAWVALLRRLRFRVDAVPMSRGTPFANVLLVADLEPPP